MNRWLTLFLSVVMVAACGRTSSNVTAQHDAAPQVASAPNGTGSSSATAVAVPQTAIATRFRPQAQRPLPKPAPDTRSRTENDNAACWGFEDGHKAWRCGVKVTKLAPKTVLAASGASTPIIPGSWTVPAWFVNPSTGDDSNSCTSSGSPCKHYYEIAVHRWGFSGVCAQPILKQNTTITFLANQTDNTDPVLWCPLLNNGAIPSIVTGTPASTAAVFTRSAAKNRSAGSNNLLAGSFSAGTPAAGVLTQNTTHASRAFIYSLAEGSDWNMTQPVALSAIPESGVPAEVDTWASTDAVNLLTPIQVDLVRFSPVVIDFDAGFDNIGYLSELTVFDPSGTGSDNVYLSNVYSQDVLFQRSVTPDEGPGIQGVSTAFSTLPIFSNCFFSGGIVWLSASQPLLWAGAAPGTLGALITAVIPLAAPQTPYSGIVDGDFISGGSGARFGNVFFGFVYLDNSINIPPMTQVTFATELAGGHVVYGTAGKTITFLGNARGYMASGTFTAGWTAPALVTGVTMNAAATACSHSAAAPDVVDCGITTSVANLDAAQGAAGFGGFAYNPGGATVTNVQ